MRVRAVIVHGPRIALSIENSIEAGLDLMA